MIKLRHREEVKTMINIRPVSDLRNNFTEIESIVKQGDPVYLTKNGYGTMVVINLQKQMTRDIRRRKFSIEHGSV